MIAINHSTHDCYSLYGISHFFQKYGIPYVLNKPSTSGISIRYGIENSRDSLISICENQIQDRLCGYISVINDIIPVFEIPCNTGIKNSVIAHFNNQDQSTPCLTRDGSTISIGIDIFKETGYLLSGHSERIWDSLSVEEREKLSSIPVVDILEDLLFKAIVKTFHDKKIPLVHKSFWPDGKKTAICLTHDVDEVKKTYQWITRPLRYLAKLDISGLWGQGQSLLQKIHGGEPYWTFNDICQLEKSVGGTSTFFFLQESGRVELRSPKTWNLAGRTRSFKDPAVLHTIQYVQSQGSEVAIHGSFYSYLSEEMLQQETKDLEHILKEKIIGIRQHHLNLRIPETWYYHVNVGLKYDTSLGFKDRIGFRWGTAFPFFPFDGKKKIPILEIPLHIMDVCLLSSDNPMSNWIPVAEEVEQFEGELGVLWHPPVFNDSEVRGARKIYSDILKWGHERNAWITSARNISGWIMQRDQTSFTVTRKSNEKFLITPSPVCGYDHYLTLHFPPGCSYEISAENTIILGRDTDLLGQTGDCVRIKTHNLKHNQDITVKIS